MRRRRNMLIGALLLLWAGCVSYHMRDLDDCRTARVERSTETGR